MKKRIVAVLLSMTMILATGAEAGAASMTDFTAEATAEEAVAESAVDADAVDDTTVSTDEETDLGEGDLTDDSSSVIVTPDEGTTEDGQTEVEEEPSADDTTADSAETEEETTADFSAGEEIAVQEETDGEAVEEETPDAAGTYVEVSRVYNDWEFDVTAKKWRLFKQVTSPQSANEEAAQPVAGAEEETSVDEAFSVGAEADVSETEETAQPETQEETVQPETQEAAGTDVAVEEETEAAGAPTVEYYKNCWVKVTTTKVDQKTVLATGTYYFNAKGYLETGYQKIDNNHYYLMPQSNAKRVNKEYPNQITPFNSSLGRMQTGWVWESNAFHYFGNDGKETALKEGFQDINGNRYYLQSNGVPVVGKKTISGNTYMFRPSSGAGDIPGKMVKNAWYGMKVNSRTQWSYYQADGKYKKMGIGAYKLLSNSNSLYLLDAYGYLITNGKMVKGADGGVYMANRNGVAYANQLVKSGKFRYYFLANGHRATYKKKWVKLPGANNRYYYFGKTYGRVVKKKGFQKVTVNGKFVGWFYFNKSGDHLQNAWAGDRYFLPDGRMASGVTKVGTSYYFFQRSTTKAYKGKRYKSTWIKYKGKYYFAKRKGNLAYKGWQRLKINKTKYWFYFNNCKAKTNCKITRNGISGYLDSRGRYTTGWVIVNDKQNKVRYIDPATGTYAKNKTLWIEGKQYRFDKKGYRVSDRSSEFRKRSSYYLECDKANGVMTVYTDSTKKYPVKTIRVSVGNPTSLTKSGTFTLERAGRWQALMGPSWGQYGTHVVGGIFVHSVACSAANSYNLPAGEYLRLGSPASHGCIRCCVADAKWVWDNCNGSKIYIFDGGYQSEETFKGPLGRKPLTPLRGSKNFDPTDPAVR